MHTLNHMENATVPHTHTHTCTHAASLEAKLPKKKKKIHKNGKERNSGQAKKPTKAASGYQKNYNKTKTNTSPT